jgi:alpha-ketoglutarate-dependent taurine dioxygenase
MPGAAAVEAPQSRGPGWQPVFHPIIRVRPETARKSLYLDPGKICCFVDVDDSDGGELIAELRERMIVPDAEYHHVWRKGDAVIWDHRCSDQKAAWDYPPEEDRINWRVSINDYGIQAAEAAEYSFRGTRGGYSRPK